LFAGKLQLLLNLFSDRNFQCPVRIIARIVSELPPIAGQWWCSSCGVPSQPGWMQLVFFCTVSDAQITLPRLPVAGIIAPEVLFSPTLIEPIALGEHHETSRHADDA
jgi:hypothetical protein